MNPFALLRSLSHALSERTRQLKVVSMLLVCAATFALGFYTGSPHEARSSPAAFQRVKTNDPHPTAEGEISQPAAPSFSQVSSTFISSDQPVSSLPSRVSSSGAAQISALPAERAGAAYAAGGSSAPEAFSALAPSIPATPRIQVPLIYQNVNPASVGLSAYQQAAINQMRSQFNAQVGQQQNTSDPQYAQSWAAAQVSMDDKLRTLLGWDKFNLYQINAAKSR